MLIYFFILGLILLAHFSNVRSKYLLYSIIFIVGLFLCFGYMTGSDWRYYELDYESLKMDSSYDGTIEFGYYLYMLPFAAFSVEFWHFFIFTKLILYFIFCHFLRKFTSNNFYLAFAIFYCYLGVFLFIDNPMRFLIASTIFLFSFKHILNKNLVYYLLICLFAFLFHKSFLLMIPFYFVLNYTYKTRYIVIAFVIFNLLILIYSEQLINFVKYIEIFSDVENRNLSEKISNYVLSDEIKDKPFSIGLIAKYIIFVFLVMFKDKIEKYSVYGKIAFNCSIISLFISRLVFIWPVSFRFVIPLSLLYCATIAMAISYSKGMAKLQYALLVIVIFAGVLFSQITSVYKYIPYSSYLSYIGYDKPQYSFRSEYNFIYSPYRDGTL